MRWMIHGTSTTAAVSAALKRHEHQATLAAECDLPAEASLEQILKTARARQMEILTTDAALAGFVGEAGFAPGRCIVYLQLEGGDVEQDDAVDRLFKRYKRLTPNRLYTVTAHRVKVRQLPVKFGE